MSARSFIAALLLVVAGVAHAGPVGGGAVTSGTACTTAGIVNVKCPPYNAKGNGTTDDTAALQAALNGPPAGGTVVFPPGTYRHTTRLVQKPGTVVRFEGGARLRPDASGWGDAYVWQTYDNWNNPPADYLNGQLQRALRTAVYGLRIEPSADLTATCFYGSDGGGIVLQDAVLQGCKAGGVFIEKGYEWKLRGVTLVAPPTVTAGAVGLKIATSDTMVSNVAVQFYPVGVQLTAAATSNVLHDVHAWGLPYETGVGRTMAIGFDVRGDSNQLHGCYADTPERIVGGSAASLSNGGVGFYVGGWNNTITAGHVVGSVRLSKAFLIDSAASNTLIGCVAPFDATRFEPAGYVVFQGTATAYNNSVLGGTLPIAQGLKAGPWYDASGNVMFGSAAVSPGFDANVGTAIYGDGSIGITRASGTPITANRGDEGAILLGRVNNTNRGSLGWAPAAPTTGSWVTGSVVYNSAPAAGQPMGWMCTSGGLPGTWRSIGNLP